LLGGFMMNEFILSILLILLGTIFTFFRDLIIKLTGKSGPGDYSTTQRKEKMLIGGICFLIFGMTLLIHFIKSY
jgi:hypothetical protein